MPSNRKIADIVFGKSCTENEKIADIVFGKYSDEQPRDDNGRFAGGGEASHGEAHVGTGRHSKESRMRDDIAAMYGTLVHMPPGAPSKFAPKLPEHQMGKPAANLTASAKAVGFQQTKDQYHSAGHTRTLVHPETGHTLRVTTGNQPFHGDSGYTLHDAGGRQVDQGKLPQSSTFHREAFNSLRSHVGK